MSRFFRNPPIINFLVIVWAVTAVWPVLPLAPDLSPEEALGMLWWHLAMVVWTLLPMGLAWLFAPREEEAGRATWVFSGMLGVGIIGYFWIYWTSLYGPNVRPDGQGAFLFVFLPAFGLAPVLLIAGICRLFLMRSPAAGVSPPARWKGAAILGAGLVVVGFLAQPFLPDWRPMALVDDRRGEVGAFLTGMNWAGLSSHYSQVDGFSRLKESKVLIIGGSDFSSHGKFSEGEIRAVADYVRGGGGLFVADHAWSTTGLEGENPPLEALPVNHLGKTLGFRITNRKAGRPVALETPLLAGLSPLADPEEWSASEIELTGDDVQVLMRDGDGRVIAGTQAYGRGRIVVFGHMLMVRDYLHAVERCLRWAARL